MRPGLVRNSVGARYPRSHASVLEVGPNGGIVWVFREQVDHADSFLISHDWNTWEQEDEYCDLYALVGWQLTEDEVYFLNRDSIGKDLRQAINDDIYNSVMNSGLHQPLALNLRSFDLSDYQENYNLAKKSLML